MHPVDQLAALQTIPVSANTFTVAAAGAAMPFVDLANIAEGVGNPNTLVSSSVCQDVDFELIT